MITLGARGAVTTYAWQVTAENNTAGNTYQLQISIGASAATNFTAVATAAGSQPALFQQPLVFSYGDSDSSTASPASTLVLPVWSGPIRSAGSSARLPAYWLSGSNCITDPNGPGNYTGGSQLGLMADENVPQASEASAAWTGLDGALYMLGGQIKFPSSQRIDSLWRYTVHRRHGPAARSAQE